MRSVVVYASRSGNTRLVAVRIGDVMSEHGEVDLFDADSAPTQLPKADIVFIGGPTEGRTVTEPVVAFLERLDANSLSGRLVALFDTRLAWPRILGGSAAEAIAKRVQAVGARVVVAPESFIVSTKPELQPGELERAGKWAADVAAMVARRTPVAAIA